MRPRLLCVFLILPLFADDESPFAVAAPPEWSRHDPLSVVGFPASFTFNGETCRISAPAPSLEVAQVYGGARAGLFAPGTFTGGAASVDFTDWFPTTDRNSDGTFVGVFTRVQSPIGLGSVNGYSASIIDLGPGSGPLGVGRNGRLQLFRVVNEGSFTPLNGYIDFPLDPARDYRLVLASFGSVHTARVFDLTRPASPVARLAGSDAVFTTGRTGVMILTDRLAPVDATFDNFLAWDGAPPPLAVGHGSLAGTIELSCDFFRSLASDLESATALAAPGDWEPAMPASATLVDGRLLRVFPLVAPRGFFRWQVP